MFKRKKTVLDEREQQELYRIEHFGLWLMYALLCAGLLVQLLCGAPLAQMACELAALLIVSVVMIIANVRHGIWDDTARPSVRGNAGYALACGVCVAAVQAAVKGNIGAALFTGVSACVLCFALMTLLMLYMQRRQKKREQELDN